VYATQKRHGVQFIGINTRDQEAAAKAFEESFDITYPSFVDPSGEIQLAFRDTLPPNSIPSTVVIDREGRVAARIVGPTSFRQLTDLVDDVASES
jgi:peroxiredoxin